MQADNADLSTNFDQNMIQNQPNGGNDITYVAQTAPGINMNTGGGYGNFQTSGLPATSNVFTVNGENDMDPYLNLNNSGATNLTLGKNDICRKPRSSATLTLASTASRQARRFTTSPSRAPISSTAMPSTGGPAAPWTPTTGSTT